MYIDFNKLLALAVVVTTALRARDLRQRPVSILAAVQGSGPEHVVMANYHKEPFLETPSLHAARELWARAGVGPGDMDCAQFYDAFTPLVTISLEENLASSIRMLPSSPVE